MTTTTNNTTPRRCKICHEPERSDGIYTTIAPRMGICADCLNRYVVHNSDQRRLYEDYHERKRRRT